MTYLHLLNGTAFPGPIRKPYWIVWDEKGNRIGYSYVVQAYKNKKFPDVGPIGETDQQAAERILGKKRGR